MNKSWNRLTSCLRILPVMAVLSASTLFAGIPPADKLLPSDTLAVVTVPDFPKMKELCSRLPQAQLWADPAMKPFSDKVLAKFQEEFVKPLERETGIEFATFSGLAQGQATFALLPTAQPSGTGQSFAMLVLLDTKDRSSQLQTNLAVLRKKATDAGKSVRFEKVRDYEFMVLTASSNDVPKTLRQFFPPMLETHELGEEEEVKEAPTKSEYVIGQADSLLIIGTSLPGVEKVVARLAGGAAPGLGEQASFAASYQSMFKDAPFYGWVNTKALLDLLNKALAERKRDEASGDPLQVIDPAKVISAVGLNGLRQIAFTMKDTGQGQSFEFLLGVPEAERQGIFRILAGEAKEASVPPFVPADAAQFTRWRIDGQKTWSTLEKILAEISPQSVNALNFLLETANTAARDKDPAFDIRKSLIGNLGDDFITYGKAPRGTSAAQLNAPPSVFLVGSPDPEKLAASLKGVFVFLGAKAGAPSEREILGRKILSIPLPSLPLPMPSAGGNEPGSRTLNYVATAGYLAFSTDATMLEEYLRNLDTPAKALRSTQGLAESAQRVTTPGTSMFGYENQIETMRLIVDGLRKDPGIATNILALSLLSGVPGMATPERSFKDWLDFSLLPPFERIAKYFHFGVYGMSAGGEGLLYRGFAPTPPELLKSEAQK